MKAALLAIAVLSAHHSHPAFYDQCTTVTVEGEVESVQWKNPHVLIDVKTAEGKVYVVEWTSSAILERTSVAPPKAGDRIVVRGNPSRDRDKPVVDIIQITRASDNWSWSRPEPPSPSDCRK